jgi:Xaa-Pro aminopeptidase
MKVQQALPLKNVAMDKQFHIQNRQRFFNEMPDNSVAVFFSGEAPRKTADSYYTFFADRNYLYLSGVDYEGLILLLTKINDKTEERLYILPKDTIKERWNGYRYRAEEVNKFSGINNIRNVENFETEFFHIIRTGNVAELCLDLYKDRYTEGNNIAHNFANKIMNSFPWVTVKNLQPIMRKLRTIKTVCEIEAIKKAEEITKAGIIAMMKAGKPGMTEYELKAEYDYTVLKSGVISNMSQPIISAGKNNFYIHYNSFTGTINDGDMILVDVGADWNNVVTDVSRAWPANGKFTKKQAALYNAAYETSNYIFSIIKPDMPMGDVDAIARKVCAEKLIKLGLLNSVDEAGKYIWHGGAHHVGWDVHDMVDVGIETISAGMIFCVDVGIYCEEWGIGFRLEDNCLVTETGCVNLSADIPRSIEEIEAVLK